MLYFGFEAKEIMFFIDCFNGSLALPYEPDDVTFGNEGINLRTVLLANFIDSCNLDQHDAKWGIKKEEVIEKIKSQSVYQLALLRMSILRFWDLSENDSSGLVKCFGFGGKDLESLNIKA